MARLRDAGGAPVRIGVTGPRKRLPVAWWASRLALLAVRAEPVRLRPGDTVPADLEGVVIGGGADVGPALYDPTAGEIEPPDPERDAFEIDVLERALGRGLPLLGICRGAQLLNVVLGGNLTRDVRSLRRLGSNRPTILPTRPVRLSPDSRLSGILLREECRVNALHRQAVNRTGRGLRVVARDLDRIPQAVEDPTVPFRVGVQWHPEYLAWQRPQRRLFRALVRAALDRRER